MANDYVPRSDAEFNGWQSNFVASANANLAGLGLVAGDLTPIITAQAAWSSAYSAHVAVQAAAQSARQTKDDNRVSLESLIRALVRRLQASPDVSDPERQQLGITVSDQERSPADHPAGGHGRRWAAPATHHRVFRREHAHAQGQARRRHGR